MIIINYSTKIKKILKENINEEEWLNAIEDQLSKLAVIISSSRLDIVSRLAKFLGKNYRIA